MNLGVALQKDMAGDGTGADGKNAGLSDFTERKQGSCAGRDAPAEKGQLAYRFVEAVQVERAVSEGDPGGVVDHVRTEKFNASASGDEKVVLVGVANDQRARNSQRRAAIAFAHPKRSFDDVGC